MAIKDGGPAFPRASADDSRMYMQDGMSLRDWFAGQALAGWYATYKFDGFPGYADIAERSYEMADAMLKAREAK